MDGLSYPERNIPFRITYLPLTLSRALVSGIDNQRRVLLLLILLEAGYKRDREKENQEFKPSVVFKGKLLDVRQ